MTPDQQFAYNCTVALAKIEGAMIANGLGDAFYDELRLLWIALDELGKTYDKEG